MKRIEEKLDEHCKITLENRDAIAKNSADTSEILAIVQAGKGFFKVAGWVMVVAKWILGLATAVIAFWISVKGLDK